MAGANLRTIDSLLHLRDALLRFRDTSASIPGQLRIRIQRAEEMLSRQRAYVRSQIEAQRIILSESEDEKERIDARKALDEANHHLSTVRHRERTLATAVARYNRVATTWLQAMDGHLLATTAFLAGKHAEAIDYQRVALSEEDRTYSSAVPGHRGAPADRTNSSADPVSATSPDELPRLPGGFSWIPIGQFAQSELPKIDDFKKVTYGDMAAGLQRVWNELIPILIASDHPNRSACERFDEANGRIDPMGFVHAESIANLWDKFFDPRFKEHIRVTYDETADRWSIDNGRHRIKAAGDLGWQYVPGELIQHSSEIRNDREQGEHSTSPG